MKTVIALVLMASSGCSAPVAPAPVQTVPQVSIYPLAIIETCPVCDCICIAYGPRRNDLFCDSDCDGWFDSVENGSDFLSTCAWDPPPEHFATVCQDLFGKTKYATLDETLSLIEAQKIEIGAE